MSLPIITAIASNCRFFMFEESWYYGYVQLIILVFYRWRSSASRRFDWNDLQYFLFALAILMTLVLPLCPLYYKFLMVALASARDMSKVLQNTFSSKWWIIGLWCQVYSGLTDSFFKLFMGCAASSSSATS